MNKVESLALTCAARQFAEANGFGHVKEITIIIPALNEEDNLKQLLPRIPNHVCALQIGVLLIDDGSKDQTRKLAQADNIGIASIPISLGQGAALRLGYELALAGGAQIIVTMDADGQHRPEEIERLIQPIVSNKADFVIGSRILGQFEQDDPIRSWGVLVFGKLLSIMLGIKITDCSSGYRAIKADALKIIAPYMVQPQFHSTELIITVAKKGFLFSNMFSFSRRGNSYSLSKPF